MILQSLNQLYERLAKDPFYGLPTPGYSVQDITFEVVLLADGTLHAIQDARLDKKPRSVKVPGEGKPPGKVTAVSAPKKAGLFWNDVSFMLGIELADTPASNDLKFSAFRENHLKVRNEIDAEEFEAICRFLCTWNPSSEIHRAAVLKGYAKTGYGVFRVLSGKEPRLVHETEKVVSWLNRAPDLKKIGTVSQQCLVTGAFFASGEIARIHQPKIKGVGQNRTLLVSFNDSAYESYGKDQSFNSPVSEQATFQYCNALNALLSGPQSRRHRVTIGDATTVFWTERETVAESLFAKFLGGDIEEKADSGDDPVMHARLEAFLNTLRKGGGTLPAELGDPETKFFILGLSGNVTRLSVRFWHVGTVAQMIGRLRSHFDALRIVPQYERDPAFPSAFRLLDQSAPYRHGKVDRDSIPPLLGGQLMQAILQGTPYPLSLYNCVLNRLRVLEKDQHGKSRERVSYLKASILKAVLTRNYHYTIPMSLDTTRTEPAYLLGRLFAALEKTQEDALPGINATIRDRFYSAASATPGAVFPRLFRTYTHHLNKAAAEYGQGYKVNREVLIGEIKSKFANYPMHLNLQDQGLFAIGYYHQRQDFFTKKDKPETTTE